MNYPVFIINGFLDSGKTTFIIDTIKNDGFAQQGGKSLLIVFEEGEVEYPLDELAKQKTQVATFASPEEFTPDVAYELLESFKPDRIIIEDNSMWDKELVKLPSCFEVAQIVSFIDFTTFGVYYNNMRQKFVDNLRFANVVIINRCDNVEELSKYQTSLKMINNNAQWVAMDSNGQVQAAFEEPLPFDVDADVIEVADDDFARWYIDTFDHKERYEGKTISFTGTVFKSIKLPKNSFVVGRHAMTCCSNDIQFYGHLASDSLGIKLKSKQWIHITAKMSYKYSEEYEEDELVLEPISIEIVKPLDNPVLNLT